MYLYKESSPFPFPFPTLAITVAITHTLCTVEAQLKRSLDALQATRLINSSFV